jgi:hypothetical protein
LDDADGDDRTGAGVAAGAVAMSDKMLPAALLT